LANGSYLSRVYPGDKVRKRQSAGTRVRVIDYRIYGVADAEPMYRLVTTILDPAQGSAQERAALYHERWEIETALGELKTTCAAQRSSCAAKRQTWCDRKSTAC
jgi:IS4 transposase